VRVVSESYFKDMDRKKKFHRIAFADSHKCAAYMAKWIMRFRPVQLTVENAEAKALLANEYLCARYGLCIFESERQESAN